MIVMQEGGPFIFPKDQARYHKRISSDKEGYFPKWDIRFIWLK